MIWDIAGHEIALTGADQSYEDTFEWFLMLVCVTCWEDESGKDFVLWKDPDELNPVTDEVGIDFEAALRALEAHLAPEATFEGVVVEAAIFQAALTNNLDSGIRILIEKSTAGQ